MYGAEPEYLLSYQWVHPNLLNDPVQDNGAYTDKFHGPSDADISQPHHAPHSDWTLPGREQGITNQNSSEI